MGFNSLQQYVTIVEFLGKTLGPDYEIVLQDLNPEHQAIVAIVNGHISGRRVGGPLTDASLQMLSSRAYESNDFYVTTGALPEMDVSSALLHCSSRTTKAIRLGFFALILMTADLRN